LESNACGRCHWPGRCYVPRWRSSELGEGYGHVLSSTSDVESENIQCLAILVAFRQVDLPPNNLLSVLRLVALAPCQGLEVDVGFSSQEHGRDTLAFFAVILPHELGGPIAARQ